MKILLASATHAEINNISKLIKNKIDVLITGIGICSTSYNITKAIISKKYDLVINTGICGSYKPEYTVGSVIQITEEEFGDLGIETKDGFKSSFESGLTNINSFPFKNGKLINPYENYISKLGLLKCKGLTVNTVSGTKESISYRIKEFNADIESMEGAAVFYCCLSEDIPFIQIRSVSNFIEPRNKDNWNIPLAVKNLNEYLNKIIAELLNK